MMIDSGGPALPAELRTMVEAELQSEAGERVLWTGQPNGRRAAVASIPIVLFAIPWTAFSVFWVTAAAYGTSRGSAPGLFRLFPLFGLPFVAIGLGMLTSPLWALRSAKKSVYLLTDRRAVVFRAGWNGGVTVRSFSPDRLTDLKRNQRADGSGDLVFAEEQQTDSRGARRSTDVGFLAIADVREVEQLVQGMVERHRLLPNRSA